MSNQAEKGVLLGAYQPLNERSPYKMFKPGVLLDLGFNTVNPDGSLGFWEDSVLVSKNHSGGFVGKVLEVTDRAGLPKDYVLKTTVPSPFHHLLRSASWEFKDLPLRRSFTQAKLGFLATNMIADPLLILTEGEFNAPGARGFTALVNGNAFAIGRVEGRGVRLDLPGDYDRFKDAQSRLTQLGYRMGLEQVGQIHPDNPFGLPNLWWNELLRRFEWFDTIAAFRHKPILGLVRYGFHTDIKSHFYDSEHIRYMGKRLATFDQIHTDYYLQELSRHEKKFTKEKYATMVENAQLYRQLWYESKHEEQEARYLKDTAYALFESVKEAAPKAVVNVARSVVLEPLGTTFVPSYRRQKVLSGLQTAVNKGLAPQADLDEAKEILANHKHTGLSHIKSKAALLLMVGAYYGTGLLTTSAEAYAEYLNGVTDNQWLLKALIAAGIPVVGQITSSIVRPVETEAIGLLTFNDLRMASLVSATPGAGSYMAFTAKAVAESSHKDSPLWHYAVREYLSKISGVLPGGGLGSDREAKFYYGLPGKLLMRGKNLRSIPQGSQETNPVLDDPQLDHPL